MNGASESPFSARTVAIMVAIAVISFGGVLVLAGWAPELRQRDQAGDGREEHLLRNLPPVVHGCHAWVELLE
jgi:hypothetical protein